MLQRKLFDSCLLNAISFRVDLRALPLKYSATDSRLRVQATHGLTSTDENFSLATATSLILTSHGEVRFLPGKWVNVGMAHHIGKTKLTSCWWLAEDCHVHIQRKACGTVLGQRWAEIYRGKGHIFLIERTSKACPSVSSVGGWPWSRAWRLAFPAPHLHSPAGSHS